MNNTIIEKDKNRIAEYDISKGIGILLVIIGHALPQDSFFRTIIYSFHMPLFFFLSGLTMKSFCEKRSFKECILGEKKLIVNYFFYSVIYIIYGLIYNLAANGNVNVKNLFWDFYETVTFFGINVLWFLATLIFGKIIVYQIAQRSDSKKIQMIISASLIILLILLTVLIPKQSVNVHGALRLVYCPLVAALRAVFMSSFILAGYSLSDFLKQFINKVNCLLALLVGVVFYALVVLLSYNASSSDFHYLEINNPFRLFLQSFLGIFATLLISKFFTVVKPINAFFKFFGTNSLFIMVTHEYFMIRAGILLLLSAPALALGDGVKNALSVMLLIIVEIILCVALKPICERCIAAISGKVGKIK